MAKKSTKPNDWREALRAAALQLPDVEEGIACAGTALGKRTMKIRGKAFLFLGSKDAMMKLHESADEATEFPACKVGAHGWATVTFGAGDSIPLEVLKKWVEESYGLFAPKQKAASPAPKRRGSQ